MRQCVGCREMKEKKSMIRIIRTPEGEFLVDDTGKKNGRGAYLCRSVECYGKAVKSGSFSRAFRMQIPEEIYDRLAKEIETEASGVMHAETEI